MNQDSSTRTSLSFLVSTVLHSSVIALIALGPTFLPGMAGKSDRDASTIDITVSDSRVANTATVSDVKVVQQETAAAVVKEAPKKVAKIKTVAKMPKKVKVEPVEQKQTIEPQEAVAVQDDTSDVVTPIEEQKVEAKKEEVAETAAAAAKAADEQKLADAKKLEEANAEAVKLEEAKKQELAERAKEELKQEQLKEEAKAQQVAAAEKAAADKAAQEQAAQKAAAEKAAQAQAAAAAAPKVIQVTQNYLGLRQQPGNKPPTYSRTMRLQKMQGRGQLVYFVNKDGQISQIRLTQSTGSAELDQAAVDAFSKYRFVPGQEGYTVHNFEFSLKGPAESDAARLRTSSLNR